MTKITEKIDGYKLPQFNGLDEKTQAFVSDIDSALRSLQTDGGTGPYGTIEAIIGAIEDFAEDWNIQPDYRAVMD